ncbi:hypothetical protein [Streptosporangium sp. KLBMP 9127]|nr:hypothetical protein [Streptosporangium sp. KLBMP 9127]
MKRMRSRPGWVVAVLVAGALAATGTAPAAAENLPREDPDTAHYDSYTARFYKKDMMVRPGPPGELLDYWGRWSRDGANREAVVGSGRIARLHPGAQPYLIKYRTMVARSFHLVDMRARLAATTGRATTTGLVLLPTVTHASGRRPLVVYGLSGQDTGRSGDSARIESMLDDGYAVVIPGYADTYRQDRYTRTAPQDRRASSTDAVTAVRHLYRAITAQGPGPDTSDDGQYGEGGEEPIASDGSWIAWNLANTVRGPQFPAEQFPAEEAPEDWARDEMAVEMAGETVSKTLGSISTTLAELSSFLGK